MNDETEKQAKKSIISNPAFHSGGIFDENIYEAQANAAGYTKDAYLEIMTDIMASELYRVSLASSGFTTKKEVKELAKLRFKKVQFFKPEASRNESKETYLHCSVLKTL